jgi:HEAT repeat protein
MTTRLALLLALAVLPPAQATQQDPANNLYSDARAALDRQRYAEAAGLFESVYTKYPTSTYAANAYYWQAYALNRRGGNESLRRALAVLELQRAKAPTATTRRDGDALATRIRGQLARGGDAESAEEIAVIAGRAATPPTPPTPAIAAAPPAPPSALTPSMGRRGGPNRDRCDNEDDIQSAALNALQSMDEDRALPILKRVLARRDPGSECIRKKAIFILSQQEGPEIERILLEAARNDPDAEVQEQAVWWLSQVDSPGAVVALDSILRTSRNAALQDKAIFALSQHDSPKARTALRDFALRPGVSEDLRSKAIFWIGQGEDPENLNFLKTLYGQLKSSESRDRILFSVSQIEGKESQAWLLQVAGDVNEDIELRKKAIFWVGQGDLPIAELFSLYERMPNREMKEHMIFVYSQRDEKAAVDKMLQIAKTETDRELRKKAIFWLSQSDDPRVAEFLAGLLEKPN